ncbi:hypothetical protein WA026_010919 [Henosepilachna vigintioctopunctata]|uniref:Uncharacterized protein n=1 Tax=Henosepilachna vigintioctopunctata TaxID=420089 RepID=A0AAW1UY32_9CUCU
MKVNSKENWSSVAQTRNKSNKKTKESRSTWRQQQNQTPSLTGVSDLKQRRVQHANRFHTKYEAQMRTQVHMKRTAGSKIIRKSPSGTATEPTSDDGTPTRVDPRSELIGTESTFASWTTSESRNDSSSRFENEVDCRFA